VKIIHRIAANVAAMSGVYQAIALCALLLALTVLAMSIGRTL
jgi:hypothetical protein